MDEFYLPDFNKNKNITKEDFKKIEDYAKKYNFKSISVKKSLIHFVLPELELGAKLTQDLYALSPHEIGFGSLSIKADQIVSQADASYRPKENVISFYNINELTRSHFVHEYTHYIQKHTLPRCPKDYPLMKQNEVWQQIEQVLWASKVRLEEVKKLTKQIITPLSSQAQQTLSQIINEKFNTDSFEESLNELLKKTDCNDDLCNVSVIKKLQQVHRAYQLSYNKAQKGFEKELWNILDTEEKVSYKQKYFDEPYEIHARINESLVFANSRGEMAHLYLLDTTKANVRALAEHFNNQLVERYRQKMSMQQTHKKIKSIRVKQAANFGVQKKKI